MYRCNCGKQLFPKGHIATCEDCGRNFMKTVKGNLVQVSRPTKHAPDLGKAPAKSTDTDKSPKRVM